MNRLLALAVAVVLTVLPTSGWAHSHHHHHHGGHSRVFIGTSFWWDPPYPYWYYPYPYYPYPYYPYYVYPPAPPVVIYEEPPVYIQQPPPQQAPAAPPSVPVESYWYYCQSAQAYYPSVQQCPEAWIKVPPRAP